MSLSYWTSFRWQTDLEALAAIMASEAALTSTGQEQSGAITPRISFSSNYFHATASKPTKQWQDILRDELQIEICTNVVFRVDAPFRTDGEDGRALTKTIGVLLKHTKGDFVFLFEGEIVLLLRDSSGLSINSDAGFWNHGNQKILGAFVNFEEKPLPTI